MNDYVTTFDVGKGALVTIWESVAGFVPRFLAAIVVFVVIWLLGILVAKIVWHLIKLIQLDRGLESIGIRKIWERSGHKLDSGLFFYELVKWAGVIAALMAATDILELTQVTDFLSSVLLYLPNVFVAAIILIIGVLVARFLETLVRASVRTGNLLAANTLGIIVRWTILIFSILIAMDQLGVDSMIINYVVIGIVIAAALAFGLAFGLGGRDHAEEIIGQLRKRMSE